MKTLYIPITLILFLAACNLDAMKPKFQKVENVRISSLSASNVVVEADAVIYNPNPISIYLNSVEIEIYAEDILVGEVHQTKKIEIAKKDNFYIPLSASFNPTKLFKDNLMGLLESSINALNNRKIEFNFEGVAQFEVKGQSFDVPIEHIQEVLLEEE